MDEADGTNAAGKGHLGREWANWCSKVMTHDYNACFSFFFLSSSL